MIDPDSFVFFAAVVEAGSLSKAARKLGMDKSNVSRRLANLETQAGAQLIRRTTRQMQLTELGEILYERSTTITSQVQEANNLILNLRSAVRGPLNISCSAVMGRLFLVSMLSQFMRTYPEVKVSIKLRNDIEDLVGEGVDVALRVTDKPNMNSIALKLAAVDWRLYASPAYLTEKGPLNTPRDLSQHHWLGIAEKAVLKFAEGAGTTRIAMTSRMACADYLFVKDAILAGLGVGQMPSHGAIDAIRSGRLVRVLADYELVDTTGRTLYAITLPNRQMPPQVRVFLDFVKQQFSTGAVWDRYEAR